MRSKTSWLPSFVLMLKRASFALFAHCTIPHLLAEVWRICHGVCKHAWNGGTLKPSRVPVLSVLLGCGSGWIPVLLWWNGRSCQVLACPRGLLLTEVDCGKCGGKRHLLGSEWEGMGVSPVSEGIGHSVQNSTQGMGKVFASRPVPLLLCTFVYFSLWTAISVLVQLLQR